MIRIRLCAACLALVTTAWFAGCRKSAETVHKEIQDHYQNLNGIAVQLMKAENLSPTGFPDTAGHKARLDQYRQEQLEDLADIYELVKGFVGKDGPEGAQLAWAYCNVMYILDGHDLVKADETAAREKMRFMGRRMGPAPVTNAPAPIVACMRQLGVKPGG